MVAIDRVERYYRSFSYQQPIGYNDLHGQWHYQRLHRHSAQDYYSKRHSNTNSNTGITCLLLWQQYQHHCNRRYHLYLVTINRAQRYYRINCEQQRNINYRLYSKRHYPRLHRNYYQDNNSEPDTSAYDHPGIFSIL